MENFVEKLNLCRTEQILFIAPEFSVAQFYLRARSDMQKKDEQNQDTADTTDQDTAGNIVFCSLLPK